MTLQRWLLPRPFDIIASGFYLAEVLLYFYVYNLKTNAAVGCKCLVLPLGNLWLTGGLIIAATILLLAVDRLQYWRYGDDAPVGVVISLLIARIAIAELIAQLDGFYYSYWLYLVLVFLGALDLGWRVGLGLGIVATVTTQIKLSFLYERTALFSADCITFALGCAFAIIMAAMITRERRSRTTAEKLLEELKQSHQQLRQYSAQIEELATTKERNRLARDIHDSLGHYLTVINVQLEKAMAFRGKQPEAADQAVSDAKRLASEALQDVRRSVSALRQSQELPSLTRGLQQLVASMQNQPCVIALNVSGDEDGFAKQGLLTLYRAAQEGLTNIQKHAQASRVVVQLTFGEDEVCLQLSDNGCGFEPDDLPNVSHNREGGYGLLGIQERLELVGGTLRLESTPGEGTCLSVSVPKEPRLVLV